MNTRRPESLGAIWGYLPKIHASSWELSTNETMGDFPGGAVVKNPPANAGDTGSSPGPGRSRMPRSN